MKFTAVRRGGIHSRKPAFRSIAGILRASEMLIATYDRADQSRSRGIHKNNALPAYYDRALRVVVRLAVLLSAQRRDSSFAGDASDFRHFRLTTLRALLRNAADRRGEESLERRSDAWKRLSPSIQSVGGDAGRERERVSNRIVLHLLESIERFLYERGDRNEVQDIEQIAWLYEELVEYAVQRTRSGKIHLASVRGRRKTGTHYTPTRVAEALVRSTLDSLVFANPAGQELEGRNVRPAHELLAIRICDPACGSGILLIEACRYLADRLVEAWKVRERGVKRLPKKEGDRIRLARCLIAKQCLYGVDKDSLAVELAKRSLWLFVGTKEQPLDFLDQAIRHGDSLLGASPREPVASATGAPDGRTPVAHATGSQAPAFHWALEYPKVFANGGFDAIITNPPWGQKAVSELPAIKQLIRQRFPSCAGIYDVFRPFIERGVQLLADQGALGIVLPDILLLKDYPQTRKFLLDHLTIHSIDWWGQTFASAAIDAVTLVGIRAPAPPDHKVQVRVHRDGSPVNRRIAQASFEMNPKSAFNLHITRAAQRILNRLRTLPTFGDFFEMHEGVHSGNIRSDLFVDGNCDATCKEMYFGRGEIRPYVLNWQGRFIRLGALPMANDKSRYANAGRSHWFEQPKILVRRTGDYVLAAPDLAGRYASNNFFVVFPKTPCALDLFGVCALLNSQFMTWFFRTIEPRQGRLFAELKIKHLCRFPLPERVTSLRVCQRLNHLGRQRANIARHTAKSARRDQETLKLDRAIEQTVIRLLGVKGLFSAPFEAEA
jgi:type I restriction-modification system DNA methylase subunit